jgi:SAM-dependent methyltransferase
MEHRKRARELAERYTEAGEPTEWFDVLYTEGMAGEADIPWADREPNPNLVAWLDRTADRGTGERALKVGCGLGDDAEELSARGFDVTAFDVAPTAIERCRERFPESSVEYLVEDLFEAPEAWRGAFDLVLESYTLQVLPPAERRRAVAAIAAFVAPGGTLLVVARGRDPDEPEGRMPWPVTEETVRGFTDHGLDLVSFEDYRDDETPPVRRFRAEFERPE